MERPTIDATGALYQAGSTAHLYLRQAIESVDGLLGPDYARKHPELLAAMVAAQVADFNNTALTSALYALGDSLEQSITRLAEAVQLLEPTT